MLGDNLTLHPSREDMANEPRNRASQRRLLIVDDEPGIRELLSELLSMEGYLTVTSATGEDAIEKSREQKFDLALIDLLMPGTSGADVARVISQESPETNIIIVTGSDSTTIERELIGIEVDGIIKKPFEMDEVLRVVADFTGGP